MSLKIINFCLKMEPIKFLYGIFEYYGKIISIKEMSDNEYHIRFKKAVSPLNAYEIAISTNPHIESITCVNKDNYTLSVKFKKDTVFKSGEKPQLKQFFDDYNVVDVQDSIDYDYYFHHDQYYDVLFQNAEEALSAAKLIYDKRPVFVNDNQKIYVYFNRYYEKTIELGIERIPIF